jgi:hypothetical protein
VLVTVLVGFGVGAQIPFYRLTVLFFESNPDRALKQLPVAYRANRRGSLGGNGAR